MKHIANSLTISRLILGFTLFFFIKNETFFVIMYSICWFTDAIDGTIARKTNSQSELGSRLDDMADYTLILIMITIMIFWIKTAVLAYIPLLVLFIVIRVINTIITKNKYGKVYIIHTYMNKLTAFGAFLLPVVYIYTGFLDFAYIVLSIGVLASLEETYIHVSSDNYNSNRKSLFIREQ